MQPIVSKLYQGAGGEEGGAPPPNDDEDDESKDDGGVHECFRLLLLGITCIRIRNL